MQQAQRLDAHPVKGDPVNCKAIAVASLVILVRRGSPCCLSFTKGFDLQPSGIADMVSAPDTWRIWQQQQVPNSPFGTSWKTLRWYLHAIQAFELHLQV